MGSGCLKTSEGFGEKNDLQVVCGTQSRTVIAANCDNPTNNVLELFKLIIIYYAHLFPIKLAHRKLLYDKREINTCREVCCCDLRMIDATLVMDRDSIMVWVFNERYW